MADKKEFHIDVSDGAAIPRKRDAGLFSAWWISLIGALATIAYLCLTKPTPYRDILAFVPDGILVTFEVTVLSILLALILGLFTGLGRISKNRTINLVASTYVEVVRGIPLLVQLFYIYFALGQVFSTLPNPADLAESMAAWPGVIVYIAVGVCGFLKDMPPLVAAVTAMGVCYGAYMGEVFRAGIESIDKGQTEAARSLGFNRGQTMFLVILPQAWRTILPPVGNEFIALLKDSSLVSILAVADLLRRGREFASVTFSYFEAYTMVALIYLVITLILSKGVSAMESRLNYYVRD
jgi:polar amino acid transport system permease protein